MCTISGVYIRNKDKFRFDDILKIMIRGEDRGKDSFGVGFVTENNGVYYKKFVGKASKNIHNIMPDRSVKIIMSNNRAEPTTEFVEDKNLKDVQPFTDENNSCIVVHNGTIANDKELKEKYNIKVDTKIDSAVLPFVLKDKLFLSDLVNCLMNEIIGSYALAYYNKLDPKNFYLMTNYKPLYLMFKNGNIFYSSLKKFFGVDEFNEKNKIVEIPPYTLLRIQDDDITKISLYKKDYIQSEKKKALIIASSGLDSTVCASWAKNKGYDITLFHFLYECRAQESELKAIHNLQEHFNCDLVKIPVDFFKKIIKNSKLLNENNINKDNHGEAGAELAHEWVPARNLIFMSIAAGYAEAYKFDYIILGGNLEESGAYPDNEYIFQKKFNDLLPNALNLQNKVEVLTPIADLMKHEIVKLGLELNAPLHLTWSCYENGDIHCGECGPCFMRRTAFRMNNKKDVIEYRYKGE